MGKCITPAFHRLVQITDESRYMCQAVMKKPHRQHLLSFVTDTTGQYLAIHTDLRGVNVLIDELQKLKEQLELNDCPHTHLFAASDSSARGLTSTKLADEEHEVNVVHHVKIYGWNEEWAWKHNLKTRESTGP